MDDSKLCAKNNVDLKGLVSTVKRFGGDLGMQFGSEKCAKVTFKRGSLVDSRKIILDINTEINEFAQNKTSKYLENTEANGINHTINKEYKRNTEANG